MNEALQNLGEPNTYLKDWITIRRIRAATYTFNPFRIIGQLLSAIVNHSAYAFKYILFSILYLLTIAFGSLCIFKMVSPAHTGLLLFPQGKLAFGYSTEIAGAHELLGSWFIPICLFITGLLYTIITHFLKMSMFKNQERYF